jgi:hypothetical protein
VEPTSSAPAVAPPERLFAVTEVGRELGRIEMTVNPARPNVSYVKSELTLAQFDAYGFGWADSIHVTRGDYCPGLKDATLDKLGRRVAGGWHLDPPAKATAAAWRRLLQSDMPLVLEAPADVAWLEYVVSRLHGPYLPYDGNCGLSDHALQVCRRLLRGAEDKVVVALGLHRQTVSFFGVGPSFDAALAAMDRRPQAWWGLTPEQRRDLLRGGFRLITRSKPAATVAP